MRRTPVLALLGALSAATAVPASAASLSVHTHGRYADIVMVGEIVDGDALAFSRKAASLQASGKTLVAVGLDSPGGKVVDAVVISDMVQKMGLMTFVSDRRLCASACFMIFAAGQKKVIGHDVYVGVHSANDIERGATEDSRQVTGEMANYVRTLGVPDAVAQKMTNTPYQSVSWLNDADLKSMGVQFTKTK